MTGDFQLADGVLRLAPDTQYVPSQIYCAKDDVKKIIVPQGAGFMEEECFAECPELEEVELPEGLINIGPAAFADCAKLRKINIPSTVKSIDTGAFFACSALREIALPEGLEIISELAFQESGLERVTIPQNTKRIEASAFFSCDKLRHTDVLGEETEICQDAFGSNYALIEGYIARGYPDECDSAAELLYTLLWCSCPQRHSTATALRAESFIKNNEGLIMERILKFNNIPAMTGLAARELLSSETIDTSLQAALKSGQSEITALLLKAKNTSAASDEEFEL